MALVDVPSLEQSAWQITIAPDALRNIPLAGRVVPPADGVSLSTATLRVYYNADWLCSFFGLVDCLVPTWEVATGRIAGDGTFSVMVPDFMNDPSVRPVAGWSAGQGYFTLKADRSEAPWSFWLSPSGASLDHLPVASEYPSLVMNASRR